MMQYFNPIQRNIDFMYKCICEVLQQNMEYCTNIHEIAVKNKIK